MKKKSINPFWLALSLLLSVLILALCVFAGRGGTLRLEAEGDPQDVAVAFFYAVVAGNYRDAYACLADYSGLGLENEPDSPTGRSLSRALRESYAFTLDGACAVNKLEATQRVSFRYLDVKAVEAAVAERVSDVAQALVAERPSGEIYHENMQYLPSFTDEVYALSLSQVLESAADYYVTVPLDIALSYTDGVWRMKTSPALFNALLGNA